MQAIASRLPVAVNGASWVDQSYLYWADDGDLALRRIPLDHGSSELVWSSGAADVFVRSVAFDECNVYIGLTNAPGVLGRGK